ncbi:uncharacterized protein MONBRDRAFT_23911 [Monosiga brevicollis MX1]|uniref:tRNA-splicing endonuclease subunit Sen54 N-terminal domain-containing protein n=1 Tax=Monosiga brevicollis TaxID=81824 RepID=A9UV74_MONBE|nr:uncharacterized protein MONBRDRAFT_23911 [Monosiga brevicollis MX1]EDQ90845.1 predicted protein [Monosiga brevicollis MX1]|eukprot:XP_001744142.1 hypothetical protein [Monosiga brevicollis MX1]
MLYPEEALFLAERGAFEIYDGDYPLSLQEATALLLSSGALTYAEYLTYTHFRRNGYHVRRHQKYVPETTAAVDTEQPVTNEAQHQLPGPAPTDIQPPSTSLARPALAMCKTHLTCFHATAALFRSVASRFSSIVATVEQLLSPMGRWISPAYQEEQPLVANVDRNNPARVLEQVRIVRHTREASAQPSIPSRSEVSQNSAPKITFDVFRPSREFRKTDPGMPAAAVVVCSFKADVPHLAVIERLSLEAHPVPLKFAYEDNGTIAFCGLLEILTPIFGPTDLQRSLQETHE